jgi:hypothetical protein
MCTLLKKYKKEIIAGAHIARYKIEDNDTMKQTINISQAWTAELKKHAL